MVNIFLLTHPVWDVTMSTMSKNISLNFYSHIPCGMWPEQKSVRMDGDSISTHTSRVGCDEIPWVAVTRILHFYSHIPCGMWPALPPVRQTVIFYFYSHIPCGMWRFRAVAGYYEVQFLLTHPVWDVTDLFLQMSCSPAHFYSHIPCGMWHHIEEKIQLDILFLLTHPVWDVTIPAKILVCRR